MGRFILNDKQHRPNKKARVVRCMTCDKPFEAQQWRIKRSKGQLYCSIPCRNKRFKKDRIILDLDANTMAVFRSLCGCNMRSQVKKAIEEAIWSVAATLMPDTKNDTGV